MNRFDLASLPICGARKRNGGTCQRYGNKQNGRCKLHGGRSTGPKTQQGKLKVATNAIQNSILWFGVQTPNKALLHEGIAAFTQLGNLPWHEGLPEPLDDVISLVAQHRIALEFIKNIIHKQLGSEAMALIQNALDLYYKNRGSQHLEFHRSVCFPTSKFFAQSLSDQQVKEQMEWDARAIRIKKRRGITSF